MKDKQTDPGILTTAAALLHNAPQHPVFALCSSPSSSSLHRQPHLPPFILSLSAVPPHLLSGITTPPPLPHHPTVPCLGTGLSSEVTLTLARALPLNPISRARYWQPACGHRYGGKVFSCFIYFLTKCIVSGEGGPKEINTFILTCLHCIEANRPY